MTATTQPVTSTPLTPLTTAPKKVVSFIQYDEPPLKAGEYFITVSQTVNQGATPPPQSQGAPAAPPPSTTFTQTRQFAVAGERFSFAAGEIMSVFPPDLSNGEFDGVLPHVVFSTRTLPWERDCDPNDGSVPWLAVLTFSGTELPTPQKVQARDLITLNAPITVAGSDVKDVGNLPSGYLSYQNIVPLDYGETPTDECMVIDIDVPLFNQIAPSMADLKYLGHIRESGTMDTEDHVSATVDVAVVMGNRVAQRNSDTFAFLVSLENLGSYLPASDGTPAAALGTGTQYTKVRLVMYRAWRYFANPLDEKLTALLEGVNKSAGVQGLTTVQLATPTTIAKVDVAMNHQANGALSPADADVLVANALAMGYAPLDHHLRHTGNTVSWYRGPLLPAAVDQFVTVPAPSADAMSRYNPQTGMFDVSFAAAWQLGQLIALQNTSFATTLYQWKKTLAKGDAALAEQAMLLKALQPDESVKTDPANQTNDPDDPNTQANTTAPVPFAAFFARRARVLTADPPAIPDPIADWVAKLRLLHGVPFSYLVPDERMLPPESLRFFYLDPNWMAALVDGALSIGRSSVDQIERDTKLSGPIHAASFMKLRTIRRNPRPMFTAANTTGRVTGFVLRSQALTGWPRLGVNGYTDNDGTNELDKLRMYRPAADVLLCLFDGEVQMLSIHEAPEQLHCGLEGAQGSFTTTLRAVSGTTPGKQYLPDDPKSPAPTASVPTRADTRTVRVADGAVSIKTALAKEPGQDVSRFTSAEFALEMVKGVIKVEYRFGAGGNS